MGVNSLPKTVIRQRRGCDLNPGPSAPESSALTTRLPSQPLGRVVIVKTVNRGSAARPKRPKLETQKSLGGGSQPPLISQEVERSAGGSPGGPALAATMICGNAFQPCVFGVSIFPADFVGSHFSCLFSSSPPPFLNDPRDATMRPYVKLLRRLLTFC